MHPYKAVYINPRSYSASPVMKIINRRSLSRKFKRCRDFIHGKLKTICPRMENKLEDDHTKNLSEDVDDHKDRWSTQLPDDVMQLIIQRLPMSDYLSCRDVCPCWRTAIDSKCGLPADKLPWLLLNTCDSFYIKDDCFVSDRKIRKSGKNHRYHGYDCAGTIDGWLIMKSEQPKNCNSRITITKVFFFLNPVSGARVMLASHPAPELCFPELFHRVKLVASSVPRKLRLQLQQRCCYVACLHLEKVGSLAFCTPGDKSWTFIEAKAAEGDDERTLNFVDIEIVDGKLYAVVSRSHALEFLMVFDIQLDTSGCGTHTYTGERLVTLHPNVKGLVDKGIYRHRDCYLAKGSESKELFMILPKSTSREKTQGFQVLKLEYDVTSGPQWVETVDLGDRAIFMGWENNKCISSHDQTLERNSIYFVFYWYETCEPGVFSLTNRSIKPLTFPKDHSHTGFDYSIWFTPNP